MIMNPCPRCGKAEQSGGKYCAYCGTSRNAPTTLRCAACGAVNHIRGYYCVACAARLDAGLAAPQRAASYAEGSQVRPFTLDRRSYSHAESARSRATSAERLPAHSQVKRKPRDLKPQLLALVAEGFLSRLSFGLISFALPLYALHLGLNLTEIGLLLTLDTVIAITFKPLMGWVGDRFGLKRSITLAIILRSAVALLLSFAGVPWQLFGIRVVHGLSASLRDPSSNALLAESGGEKAVGSAFAWQHTATSIAGSLGKTIAGILLGLALANYSLVFVTAFLLSSLPLIVVLLFVQEPRRDSQVVTQPAVGRKPREPQRWQNFLPYIGFGFLITGSADMLSALFPVLATQYAKLTESQTGMIYLISILAVLVAGPLFGWLSDHVSRKLVLTLRSVANTLSSLIFMLAPTYAGIAIGKTTDDLGKAAFRPAWGSLMTHVSRFDRRRRARAMSWMTMGEDAGGIVGPILAGFLWTTWGVGIALGVRIGLAIFTEVYAFILVGSVGKEQDHAATSLERAQTRRPLVPQ